jgi:predicted phage baseplate assembly protein
MFSLAGSDTQGLGFVGDNLRSTQPEIVLADEHGQTWSFQRTLLEVGPDEPAFTLEDGSWRPIISFHTPNGDLVQQDYATGLGYTVRFGDGTFGRPPENLHFVARYRTGPGASANVSSGAITALALPGQTPPPGLVAVTNPLPVTNGVDPESAQEIKNLVPDAYQANVLFALQPGDYGTQAKQLSFVQQADATQRWTGSWPTIFVAADPFGGSALTTEERTDLTNWMDCVRQTARDVQVRDPRQLAIDLQITICLEPFAHPSEVLAQVQEVLLGPGTGRRIKGVFHPDNFSFGTPLRRSVIEAAIQAVTGVRSVVAMLVRPRGVRSLAPFTALTLSVAPDQIIRLDNDPVHPENGTLTLLTEGGA